MKIRYLLLAFFFSFFIGLSARAEISQLTVGVNDQQYGHVGVFQKIGTGINQNLAGFYLRYIEYWGCMAGYATPKVDLVECPDASYTGCTTKIRLVYGATVCGSDNILYLQAGIDGTYATVGTGSYQTDPTKYYYIYQYLGTPLYAYADLWTVGATAALANWSPPPTGEEPAECGSLGTPCSYDYLYFKILNATDIYSAESKVSRLTPENGKEHLDNHMQFTGFYSNTLYDQLIIDIWNRTSQQTENTLTETATLGTGQIYVVNNYLNDGNYSYNVYLKNSTVTTTSGDIYDTPYFFTVGTSTPFIPPYKVFDISETNICAGMATSTWFGSIECGLKKTLAWAVYPDQKSLGDFAISYSQLKSSFPFNAFFDLTKSVQDAIATTTLADSHFDIPFITATGTYYMLPVVSSSSLPNLIGAPNSSLFRNTITWALWGLAGFLIFLTVKSI